MNTHGIWKTETNYNFDIFLFNGQLGADYCAPSAAPAHFCMLLYHCCKLARLQCVIVTTDELIWRTVTREHEETRGTVLASCFNTRKCRKSGPVLSFVQLIRTHRVTIANPTVLLFSKPSCFTSFIFTISWNPDTGGTSEKLEHFYRRLLKTAILSNTDFYS